jgi:hypothetical protein
MSPITCFFSYDAGWADPVPPSNLRDINTRATSVEPSRNPIWTKSLVAVITKVWRLGRVADATRVTAAKWSPATHPGTRRVTPAALKVQ